MKTVSIYKNFIKVYGRFVKKRPFSCYTLSEDVAYEAKDKIDHSIFNSSFASHYSWLCHDLSGGKLSDQCNRKDIPDLRDYSREPVKLYADPVQSDESHIMI